MIIKAIDEFILLNWIFTFICKEDLRHLSQVHTLILLNADISYASPLRRVHTLEIDNDDEHEINISDLTSVHALYLDYTRIRDTDLSFLKNLHTLSLMGNQGKDLRALRYLYHLNIIECQDLILPFNHRIHTLRTKF